MLLRKITCPTCGSSAQKPVKDYYIYCDSCGGFVDIDLTALKNVDLTGTTAFAQFAASNAQAKQAAVASGDRETFKKIERAEWAKNIECTPDMHPRGVDVEGERRTTYLDWWVETSAERAFNPQIQAMQAEAYQSIADMGWPPDEAKLMGVLLVYVKLSELQIEIYKEKGISDLYPDRIDDAVSKKMTVSGILQGWSAHLSARAIARVIEEHDLGGEYTWVSEDGAHSNCSNCGASMTQGPGSATCSACGTTVQVGQASFKCGGCGAPLSLEPDATEVACPFCNAVTRTGTYNPF